MSSNRASLDVIEHFLAQKRIALVGVSREPKDFTVILFNEFVRRGYEVIPVNPNAQQIQGLRCFTRMQDIQPPVDSALLMTTPEITNAVVLDCLSAGVKRIWMYGASGRGAVSPEAVKFCHDHGMEVVPGECPFMFWQNAGLHAMHGIVRKIVGRYPVRERRAKGQRIEPRPC